MIPRLRPFHMKAWPYWYLCENIHEGSEPFVVDVEWVCEGRESEDKIEAAGKYSCASFIHKLILFMRSVCVHATDVPRIKWVIEAWRTMHAHSCTYKIIQEAWAADQSRRKQLVGFRF